MGLNHQRYRIVTYANTHVKVDKGWVRVCCSWISFFYKSGKSRHRVVVRTFKWRFKRFWEILLYDNQMIWNHFSIFPSYLNNEIHNTGLEFLADKLSSGDATLNIHAFKIIFNIPNSLISHSFNKLILYVKNTCRSLS